MRGQCYPDVLTFTGQGTRSSLMATRVTAPMLPTGTIFSITASAHHRRRGPQWRRPARLRLVPPRRRRAGSVRLHPERRQPVRDHPAGQCAPVEGQASRSCSRSTPSLPSSSSGNGLPRGPRTGPTFPVPRIRPCRWLRRSRDQGARYRALVWTDDPELYLPMLSCPATLSLTLPATGATATPLLPIGALALLVLGLLILRLRHEHDRRHRTGSQRA